MVTDLRTYDLGGATRVTWSTTRPVSRVFVDGVLVRTTVLRSVTLRLPDGATRDVRVVDDEDDAMPAGPGGLAENWPSTVRLQWYGGAAVVDHYRIEQQVGAVWTARATVRHRPHTYLSWESPTLADDTTHAFRVVPVSAAGNDGPPATVGVLMVRRPDVPAATFAYGGGKVTIG